MSGLGDAIAEDTSPTDHCISIVDDAKRLSCYDRAVRAPVEASSSSTTPRVGKWGKRIQQNADRDIFTLTTNKPNYIMHTYLDSPNQEPYEHLSEEDELNNNEVKFQLNFQTKLADNMIDENVDLWFGYTQVAYWQLYSDDISSPFRETNYLPEIYLSMLTDYEIFGMTGRSINLGIVHQSNGRSDPLSRSWNRIMADFTFEHDNLALSIKPWIRIEESSSKDDNPDIEDYLGNYELLGLYAFNEQLFSVMARNIFDSEHRYNAELQWSFPINRRLRGLLQWYNGYGENMIDYNHKNNRVGIGVLLTDWL
jgi:phospholipase A1